jgi:sugar lactone lactonase YvrE
MTELHAELVLDAQAVLGEGPIWDAPNARLYWVDIMKREVHVHDPASGSDRTITLDQQVGTVVRRRSSGLMLAVERGFAHLDLDTETLTPICDPEEHAPGLRFNDGKCDPAGRFWAGTMGPEGTANLYCLFPDLTVKKMLDGVTTSNGICWSLDAKTMYYIDTPTGAVAAFDYDAETGEIGNRRVAVSVPEDMGHPDGMSIDAEGKLWVAHWDGWSVNRWDPETGERLATIAVPAAHVSSCAFGGPNLDDLYITTAALGLDCEAVRDQPHAGGLFVARPGVRGVEAFEFAG